MLTDILFFLIISLAGLGGLAAVTLVSCIFSSDIRTEFIADWNK